MSVQRIWLSLLLAAALAPNLPAQQKQPAQEPQKPEPITKGLPRREVSEKKREKREKALRKELQSYFRKWLQEDVGYIIAPEEKDAFRHLNTDEEREQFIEQFWLRRDPTPDTIENEFKEEHYRRIAYANERFGVGRPGWRSDRGRIYILHGAPDNIESHTAGALYQGAAGEDTLRRPRVVYPFERWRYHYLEGIGSNKSIEFLDRNGDGDYKLMLDPTEKEVFLTAGPLTRAFEPLSRLSSIEDRADVAAEKFDQLERISFYMKVQKPPEVKFKDLEALVTTRISFNLLPFEIRTDFIRVTGETVLVPITVSIEKANLTFQLKDGLQQAVVNVFARISTLSGRNVQTFEDVIQLDVPPHLLESTLHKPAIYQKAVPLRPGLYKLDLVLKDLNSGNVGTLARRLPVPRFPEDQLAHSSLVLADQIEQVAQKNVGSGQFVIGDTKVRPVVRREFQRNERLGIYLQVYNLGIEEGSNKPNATIEFTVMRGKQKVFNHSETTGEIELAGPQITVAKFLSLEAFPPGRYRLLVSVTDQTRGQTIQTSANFRVLP
jgi:GWxTD domain-containing protein